MIAYELTTAIFAAVILFALVLFPISGYVRAVAMGALDFFRSPSSCFLPPSGSVLSISIPVPFQRFLGL
jgi:hypothetical protein